MKHVITYITGELGLAILVFYGIPCLVGLAEFHPVELLVGVVLACIAAYREQKGM